jgi:hypothetical protein
MSFTRRTLLTTVAGAIFCGCGSHTRTRTVEKVKEVEVYKECPVSTGNTSGPITVPGSFEQHSGVNIWIPRWLNETPELKTNAIRDILTTQPESDSRIRPEVLGVPAGYTVYIQDPGSFSTSSSPTFLAVGQTDMISNLWLAWRSDASKEILLPALKHELRHVYTNDPMAGH